jgi:hypothetical protein
MAHLGVEGIGDSNMRRILGEATVELAASCRTLGTGLEPVPAGLTIIRIVSVLSMPRSDYGREKTVGRQEEKLEQEKVWKGREQTRRERDAPTKTRNVEERPRWKGRQGEEPQAGHRHRALGSAQEGREGPAKEGWTQEEPAGIFAG